MGRRWRDMNLQASRGTEERMTHAEKVALVKEQLALNPARCPGQLTVKKQIALRTGIHLKR